MGEVYRALDSKLGRDVAIKVLPDELAESGERLRRFQREAKVLASLNHPNIAAIYGLEEQESIHYLVLELVPGETLADRIARGPIAWEEAVAIATKIAEALEEAHAHGIVHRDLKPANVKLTPDGKVKVLDFGLAKPLEQETGLDENLSHSPTVTRDAATGTGVILGTASYMSPEQARGKPVDARSDVWAFGCCLYEMLSGKRAFPGTSLAETLAAILAREPEWEALPSGTPENVRRVLRRALVKNARGRLQHMGDARIELSETELENTYEPTTQRGMIRNEAYLLGLVGAALGAVMGAGIFSLVTEPEAPPPRVRHVEITTEPQSLFFDAKPEISPDGETILYLDTEDRPRLRALSEPIPTSLADVVDGTGVFFSSDGEWVAWISRGRLWKIRVAGGAPVAICDVAGSGPRGGSWGDDGTIVFSDGIGPLMAVSENGGTARPLTRLDEARSELQHQFPSSLPGGRGVLFQIFRGGPGGDVGVLDSRTGEHHVLIESASDASYLESGHLVFYRDGTLLAAGFDLGTLEVTTDPVPVVPDVLKVPSFGTRAQYATSGSGNLVYMSSADDGARPRQSLVWVDGTGKVRQERSFEGYIENPSVSPDGERVVLQLARSAGPDLWIVERARPTLTRFTFDGGGQPSWAPDGTHIAFVSGRSWKVHWKRTDGSGQEQLSTSRSLQNYPSVSPDGQYVAFQDYTSFPRADILILPLEGDREPFPFVNESYNEVGPEFSPDGRFIVFASQQSQRFQVFVKPFPEGEARLISTEGGRAPRWSTDGRTIYFTLRGWMMAADITMEPVFRVSEPRRLFEVDYDMAYSLADVKNYDVTPDGGFVFIRHDHEPAPTRLHVVEHWIEELRRVVPLDAS